MCRSLLPKGFQELKKTTYYFSSGSSTLSDAKKSLIGDIGLYVNADPSVIAVLVDGYSDAKGNRLENLRLSRIRAEHVEESLLLAGIRPSLLQVRAHGVRALIGNPESSLNRRVVVRLVKKPAGEKMMSENTQEILLIEPQKNQGNCIKKPCVKLGIIANGLAHIRKPSPVRIPGQVYFFVP